MKKYYHNNRVLEVLQGLGGVWMVGTIKKNGTGRSRFVSKACPVRDAREESQADLDAYAKKHHLPIVETF